MGWTMEQHAEPLTDDPLHDLALRIVGALYLAHQHATVEEYNAVAAALLDLIRGVVKDELTHAAEVRRTE
jgi:uncharacterized membrane protein